MTKSAAVVGIVMGSASDRETMSRCYDTLKEFDVAAEMKVLSAHRTPEETTKWARTAEERGVKVIIAAAGLAAHLAGVVAAQTVLPVIGVPLAGGALQGFDSLLSTVQMPKGTPVGTVAIGSHGAVNAALLAIRILGLHDKDLAKKLREYQEKLKKEVLAADFSS